MKPRFNSPGKVIWHHSNGTVLSHCTKTQHHNVDIVNEAHKQRWPGFTSQMTEEGEGEIVL